MTAEKRLLVGLGNPGREYQQNRHNVGFQIVNYIVEDRHLGTPKMQNHAFVVSGRLAGAEVVLARPQLFMNRSGQPVASLARFYKIPLERILIIYDELDLPTGTIRLRPEGGSGGHNGMKDIIRHLGSQSFPRLRVGIGRPPGRMDPAAYVLQDFSADEIVIIQDAYERAAKAVETWLASGVELAMSRHNGPANEE